MEGDMPMSATTSATLSEFSVGEPITESPVRVRTASRGFVRYMLAICIGVAATLAWQSYGQTAKRIIATRVPELGWSPETKQTIANWLEQLGWTKLPTSSDAAARLSLPETAQAATVAQTAPDKVAPRVPIAASVDPQQIQQIARDIAGLRQSIEQVVAGQTKMAGEINNLLVTDMEIFLKIPTPPQPPAALSRKPIPAAPPLRAPNRRTDVTPNQSLADSFRN
jgi:hypothetical protein